MLGLLTADIGTAHLFGGRSTLFVAINDGVLILLVGGLANLWAQSGMRARDVALLAAVADRNHPALPL
jgi:hypothetical protein